MLEMYRMENGVSVNTPQTYIIIEKFISSNEVDNEQQEFW